MESDGFHAEGIASYSADVTWGYRRRSFVGELPRWGGGAVMDLSVEPAVAGSIGGSVFPAASAGMMAGAPAAAGTRGVATSAPAVAGSIGGNVFPAEPAEMMTSAPAAAGSRGAAASAPAVAGGFGGNVFPAKSAGMMAGALAAAGSRGAAPVVVSGSGGNAFPAESSGMMAGTPAAAGSSGAAFQAASSAVRPPPAIAFASDDHEDYQVRRRLVDPCFCAVILASVFTVLAFRYCVTHVGSARRPHSLDSRSLLFSSGPFLLVLSYFLLYLDRTADNYPAVENHGGGL